MRISIAEACRLLIQNQVVAIPTETVYGLAAPLASPEAIQRVFTLKGRPAKNPLIIHIADVSHLVIFSNEIPPSAYALAEAFWPGPLTLVIPIDPARVPEQPRAGLPTAAFRVPNCIATLSIIRQVGPLVAPSANLSGSPSATRPEHVEEDFGDLVPVVDGGACQTGVESTILVYKQDRWWVGRLGALSTETLEGVLGYLPEFHQKENASTPLCPGSLFRHYAPKARLILGYDAYDGFYPVVVGFSDRVYQGANLVLPLGATNTPEHVMQNLYEVLRQLDRLKIPEVWVDMDLPRLTQWDAIRERLSRAAQ